MKNIFALLFVFVLTQSLYSQRSDSDITSFVDSIVGSFRGNTNSAVIVGLITMPESGPMQSWKFTYGHLSRDTSSSPKVNDSTLFQIGSITKTFTTTILSMLVNDGIVSLYDYVQSHLPDSVKAPAYVDPVSGDSIKIRLIDLATHHSGLPDEPAIDSGGMTTYKQMYDYLATYQLTIAPGECYLYSDLGIALLGVAIQHILQDSIELLIPDLVCDTLGMKDSKIINLTQSQLVRRSLPYGPNGNQTSFNMVNWPAYHGAGGLYSTLNDMLKYLAFAMRIGLPEFVNIRDTLFLERKASADSCPIPPNTVDSVGLAWQFAPLYPLNPASVVRRTFKDGSTSGFCSFIVFARHPVTNSRHGVVMVSNWKNPGPLTNAAIDILKYKMEFSAIGIENNNFVTGYELKQNYPNPFNPFTTISFRIPIRSFVTLKIFDVTGKELSILINSNMSEGKHEVIFDARELPSGVYFYTISAGDFIQTRKMILAK